MYTTIPSSAACCRSRGQYSACTNHNVQPNSSSRGDEKVLLLSGCTARIWWIAAAF